MFGFTDIVESHKELRCPECRVLIETKIKDLPPNVLLIRILEGIKSAAVIPALNSILISNQNLLDSTDKTQTKDAVPTNCENAVVMVQNKERSNNEMQTQQLQKPQQQIQMASAQSAIALYDFQSTEVGDLNFKKGDKVTLRSRLDENWFIGECNGREGAFPVNYVKIIETHPQKAQCRALYDFDMGPNEEEGCLTLKKGAIVNVIRRVDRNWVEGRIGDNIGIFPIAFVEMNSLAKLLMDVSVLNIHNISTQRNVCTTPLTPTPVPTPAPASAPTPAPKPALAPALSEQQSITLHTTSQKKGQRLGTF